MLCSEIKTLKSKVKNPSSKELSKLKSWESISRVSLLSLQTKRYKTLPTLTTWLVRALYSLIRPICKLSQLSLWSSGQQALICNLFSMIHPRFQTTSTLNSKTFLLSPSTTLPSTVNCPSRWVKSNQRQRKQQQPKCSSAVPYWWEYWHRTQLAKRWVVKF